MTGCKPLIGSVLFLSFAAIAGPEHLHHNNDDDEAALMALVTILKKSENHHFLASLQPRQLDCNALFKTKSAAETACDYANEKYKEVDKLGRNAMKPEPHHTQTDVIAINLKMLEDSALSSHPFQVFAKDLNQDAVLYTVKYSSKTGEDHKLRGVFFKGEDKWVFIPRLDLAFASEPKIK